ncbi:MAG TPA: hypothetical protein VGU71_09980 [Candidatus Dormibacteraeota bacterium]|nr:hypothetical protein [Candidatus Dormibacteraeota bacterium]
MARSDAPARRESEFRRLVPRLGNDLPRGTLEVFSAAGLLLLGLAGVAHTLLASLLHARWVARTRVAEVLHSE